MLRTLLFLRAREFSPDGTVPLLSLFSLPIAAIPLGTRAAEPFFSLVADVSKSSLQKNPLFPTGSDAGVFPQAFSEAIAHLFSANRVFRKKAR